MKLSISMFGVWLLASAGLLAADSVEDILQQCQELISKGQAQSANTQLERLLESRMTDEALWSRGIRMQMEAGLLPDSAKNLNHLMLLSGSSTPKPEHQKLREGLLARHLQELDRILAMKVWSDVGDDADQFSYRVAALLQTASVKHPEKSSRVVRHVFGLLLESPEEKRHQGIRDHEQLSSAFLTRLGSSPALMETVLSMADEYNLPRQRDWAWDYATNMSGLIMTESLSAMSPVFTESLLAADVNRFRDVALVGTSSRSLLGEVVSPLAYAPYRGDLQKQVLKLLEARQPRTFGTELIGVMLERDNQEAIKAFLKRRREDLGKLKPEAASTMLALLSTGIYAIESPAPLPDELAVLLKPLLDAEKVFLDAERLAWQSCQTLEDAGLPGTAGRYHALRLLERLVARDPEKVAPFFDHTVELLRGRGSDGSLKELAEFLQEASRTPELIKLVVRHAAREGISQKSGWLQETFSQGWYPGGHSEQPQRLLTFLEAAGLLGDARSFASQWVAGENHAKGFIPRVKLTLESRREAYDAFVPALRDRQPRTFGADMLHALITAGDDSTIVRVVAARQQEIMALPADQQAEMAAFLSEWEWDLEALVREAPALRPLLLPRVEERRAAARTEMERILAANSLDDIRKGASQELNALLKGKGDRASFTFAKMAANLGLMMKTAPEPAAGAFEKMGDLIQQADAKRGLPASWPFTQTSLGGWYLLCCSHASLLEPARTALARRHVSLDLGWVQKTEDKILPPSIFAEAANTVALLESYHLLGDEARLGSVRTLTSRPVLELVAERFRGMPAAAKEGLVQLLRSRAQPALGSDIMLALLSPTAGDAGRLLQQQVDAIRQLDRDDKLAALQALRQMFPELAGAPGGVSGNPGALGILLSEEDDAERLSLAALQNTDGPLPATPSRGWVAVIADELARLLDQGEKEKAARLFDQAMRRLNAPPEARSKSAVFTGPVTPRRLPIEPFLESGRSLQMMAFVLERAQADTTGLLLSAPLASGNVEGLLLEERWRQKGGWVNPGPVVGELLRDLYSYAREVPASTLSVPFYHFMKQMPAPLRREVLAWTSQQRNEGPESALIREMEAAAGRSELADGVQVDQEVLWKHYEKAVSDPEVNSFVRLQLGSSLCREHGAQVPVSVVLPVMQLALDCWKEGEVVPAIDVPKVLGCFARLPASPEWKTLAAQLAAEWEVRVKGASQDRSPQVYMEVFQAIVTTLCKLGDEPRLNLFFETYSHPSENWLAVLAMQGQTKWAAAMARRDWQQVAATLSRPTGRYFLSIAVPGEAMVAGLRSEFTPEEADLALLTEGFVLLAAKPATVTTEAEPWNQWRTRMDDLVTRVVRMPPVNREQRLRLHTLLAQAYPVSLTRLAPVIATEAASFKIEEIGSFATPAAPALALEVLATSAACQVMAGDVTVVQRDLPRILSALRVVSRHNDSARAVGKALYLRRLLECLSEGFPTLSRQQQDALVSSMLTESPLSDYIRVPAQGDEVVVKQVLRMLAETLQREDGTVASGSRVLPSDRDASIRALVLRLSGTESSHLDAPLRMRLLLGLLSLPSVKASFNDNASNLPRFIKETPILTPKELLKDGVEMANPMSRNGNTARELALMAVELGESQRALEFIDLAIEQTVTAADTADRLRLLKANILIRQKQMAEARAILQLVTSPGAVTERDTLRRAIDSGQ